MKHREGVSSLSRTLESLETYSTSVDIRSTEEEISPMNCLSIIRRLYCTLGNSCHSQ